MRRLAFHAAALALLGGQAHADDWFSDNAAGVRWGAFYANPGGGEGSRNVNKTILNLSHFDVWKYGQNFANVDVLFSNANEPANNSSGGSTEMYALYRGQLDLAIHLARAHRPRVERAIYGHIVQRRKGDRATRSGIAGDRAVHVD